MKAKVIGIGLNKTATKSLAQCLEALGYQNQSYSLTAFHLYQAQDWQALFNCMDKYDSFEDWPWPLMYREIDERYPDARFILTTRATADLWYESLCKMAVRMGPLKQFEEHIYGYAMPHGRRKEHLRFYEQHNQSVRQYFANKPGKLLEISFDDGANMTTLCQFLGHPPCDFALPHANKSAPVYAGDTLWRAHISRVVYQSRWYSLRWLKKCKRRLSRYVSATGR